MASRAFAAKYDGRCASDDCDYGTQISPGDEVEYADDDLMMHTACASRARRRPPLCTACFQYHRGECA